MASRRKPATADDLKRAGDAQPRAGARPAAFLDRDGVLNADIAYLHRPEDCVWTQGAAAAVKLLNDRRYLVIVVSNQSGIARGYYGVDEVEALHAWMNAELAKHGAHVDAFYYCPHHPREGLPPLNVACDCRKPAPGMLVRAMAEWPIRREGSFLIGDRDIDIEAARRAGLPGHLFTGGDLFAVVSGIVGPAASRARPI